MRNEDLDGQYCTFYVGGELYGIGVCDVQEVVLHQEMTPAPHAPAAVKGLINLRGQVVVAIDLRALLGLGPLPSGAEPTNIVTSANRGAVSLLVDEIGDVLELDGGFEAPPVTLSGRHRALVRAVCLLQGQLLHVLDVAAATSLEAA